MAWGWTYLVVGIALWIGETNAIIALVTNPEQAIDTWWMVALTTSMLGIVAGLFVIFYLPVTQIATNATSDTSALVSMRVPWGRTKRIRRDIVRTQKEIEISTKESRDIFHDALMMKATILIQASEAERTLWRIEGQVSSPEFLETLGANDRRKLQMLLQELRSEIDESYEQYEYAGSVLERARASERVVAENSRRGTKILRKVDKMIQRGGSAKDLDSVRRRLAEMSQ